MMGINSRIAIAVFFTGFLLRLLIASDIWGAHELSMSTYLLAIGIGIFHDSLVVILITSILYVASRVFPRSMGFLVFLFCFLLALEFIADLFFWWEFESRLNRLVFHYLLFPEEVLVFLEEQFFISLLLFPFLVLVYGIFRLVWKEPKSFKIHRTGASLLIVSSVVILFSFQPISFSESRKINVMASNGWLSLLHDAVTNEKRWHGRYWNPPPYKNDSPNIVLGEKKNDSRLENIRHVVLIIEESFGGKVWKNLELREKYLPNFSRLMEQGLYFSNLYATGSRTTRGLESILNGFPPLPGISVTQRDGYHKLPSLPRALSKNGFHNIFVYGGWPNFSNFSSYWEALGFDEQTSREDFTNTEFETSWGVADEELFAKIRTEMGRLTDQNERVFLTALTVSYHRPFDIPEGKIGFPANSRQPEYALAYADWALGNFFSNSWNDAWFRDTLFIVVADHGPNIEGDTPIPIEGFRVPMVLYSPEHIVPGSISQVGSTMSIGVTLLGLLGIENDEGLYGDNLINAPYGIVPVEHDYHVGLISNDGLTVLHRNGHVSSWERLNGNASRMATDYQQAAKTSKIFGQAHDWFYSEDAGKER